MFYHFDECLYTGLSILKRTEVNVNPILTQVVVFTTKLKKSESQKSSHHQETTISVRLIHDVPPRFSCSAPPSALASALQRILLAPACPPVGRPADRAFMRNPNYTACPHKLPNWYPHLPSIKFSTKLTQGASSVNVIRIVLRESY